MPQVVSFDKMKVGKKGGGKHWTKDEVKAREAAAQSMQRKTPVKPKPPKWLKEDKEAYALWKRIIKDAKDLDLIDNLDAMALATYCKLESAKAKALLDDNIKRFESLSKTSLTYAKALGVTPEARARLAKKRAEHKADPNADLFD
ncbi:MAG: P27 family phage terminase small subunit [Firmicutes bacterium]|nr:P27 family phage terminase small subunit [Bacillota bacterium]